MVNKRIQDKLKKMVVENLGHGARVFVFGSSAIENKFHDIDLGIIDGDTDDKKIRKLLEELEESDIPYNVDVVNMNEVDKKFRDKVLSEKIIWLT